MLAVMVQLHPNETSVVGVGVLLAASGPSPLHRAGLVEHCSGDNEIELDGGGVAVCWWSTQSVSAKAGRPR